MTRLQKGAGSSQPCLYVLRIYGPVNPIGSCQAQSVYVTTLLLGKLSPVTSIEMPQ